MCGLDAFRSLNVLWWVTLLNIPISGESCLFLSFNFNLDKSGKKLLENLNKDLSVNKVTGLIKGEFGLHLNTALGEITTGIAEIDHSHHAVYLTKVIL